MVPPITIAPEGPDFCRFVMGYLREIDGHRSAGQLVSFID